MPCPTCDHTLSAVNGGWFWCPRCGTIATRDGIHPVAPKLVARMRKYAEKQQQDRIVLHALHQLGILECLFPPDYRLQKGAHDISE